MIPSYTSGIAPSDDPEFASTRDRLIEAAIETFGRQGFEVTTTRLIARRANTQLTAIAYHFINKEGLYRAAADHIGSVISMHMAARLLPEHALLESRETTRDHLVEALCRLLHGFALVLLGPDIPDYWSSFVSREMAEPTSAFPLIFERMIPLIHSLSTLVGRLRGRDAKEEEIRVQVLMLMGQVLVFKSSRAAALRVLGKKSIEPATVDLIATSLSQHVRGLFLSESGEKAIGANGGP